jgi:hypothetical protein
MHIGHFIFVQIQNQEPAMPVVPQAAETQVVDLQN